MKRVGCQRKYNTLEARNVFEIAVKNWSLLDLSHIVKQKQTLPCTSEKNINVKGHGGEMFTNSVCGKKLAIDLSLMQA